MVNRTCSVSGCRSPHYCKGYCRKHHSRWKRHGDPGIVIKPTVRGRSGCLVDGCKREHHCQGYCRAHYSRLRKTGEVGLAAIAPRRKGTVRVDGPQAECEGCGIVKAAEDYYLFRGSKAHPVEPYRRQPCKDCVKAERKAWRDANPELLSERQFGYQLWFKYRITCEDYDALLAGQGGGCAICGAPPEASRLHLHVDHDHETGTVRGILCGLCNTALGLFGEDLDLMERAAAYLEASA